MRDEYAPWKGLYHLDRLRNPYRPVFVQLDLTNRCNLRCKWCVTRKRNAIDSAEWSWDDLCRLLDVLKRSGVKAIEITGGGEPTLHSQFEQFVLEAAGMEFELALVTNGTTWHDRVKPVLKYFEWVRISVDVIDKEAQLRLKGRNYSLDFELHRKPEHVIVGASFIITRENYKDIPKFAAWAKEQGFDNVRFSYDHDADALYYAPIKEELRDLLDEAAELEDENFAVFALKERLDIWRPKRYSRCYYSDLVLVLDAEKKAYRCCEWKHRSGPGCYGEIKLNEAISLQFRNRPLLNPRRHCPPCWMNAKNEFLEWLLKPEKRHVNFV